MAQKIAKEKGYSDVLYLDAVHKKYLEEVSSCNIFVVKVRHHCHCQLCLLPAISD
jgi:branched-subunit amino acid aminotransferase/4-amino-4-deoxychorismate lyase